MAEKEKWKRPQDIRVIRTSDPKEMVGRYLPHQVIKTHTEEFVDEATGEKVPVERNEVVATPGLITQEKMQQIRFAILAGDIEDVEVCDEDVADTLLVVSKHRHTYNVEICCHEEKYHYVVFAQSIPQAIKIATDFGQVYKHLYGWLSTPRVVSVDAVIIPDDHQCIPEQDRTPAYEDKAYFKVGVRKEWVENGKRKKEDTYFVVAAREVGEAKERIARLLDIRRAERERDGYKDDPNTKRIIRKALPFDVDCIVPMEYSQLYYQEPNI